MFPPITKKILILAGPNGAGKTTFAREFLVDEAECPTFVNADLIRRGAVAAQPTDGSDAKLGREPMNPKPIDQAKNPLLGRALPALIRARKRAEEVAIATNTELVEMVDGKIVFVRPSRSGDDRTAR